VKNPSNSEQAPAGERNYCVALYRNEAASETESGQTKRDYWTTVLLTTLSLLH